MKPNILRRAMLAGAIATSSMIGITAATPAHAQFGGIVYDPTNYAQNVLTAARSLQQINNQIQQIQQQATSLINEARNLASLPFSSLQQLQQQVQRTQQLLGEAQRIAIGRALLSQPSMLLFDEPLSALDQARREELIPYLQRVRDEIRLPIVYVSHHPDEVRRVADSTHVLD